MKKRMLDPEFFTCEELGDVSFEARLLFQGLWCMADRDGLLEDKRKRIKAKVFPYDEVDISATLAALQSIEVIVLYEVEGRGLIFIPNFGKKQSIHKNERSSGLPFPENFEVTGSSPVITGNYAERREKVVRPISKGTSKSKGLCKGDPVAAAAPPARKKASKPPAPPPELTEVAPCVYLEPAEIPKAQAEFAERKAKIGAPHGDFKEFLADFANRKSESKNYRGRRKTDLGLMRNWGFTAYFEELGRQSEAARKLSRNAAPGNGYQNSHPARKVFRAKAPQPAPEVNQILKTALGGDK